MMMMSEREKEMVVMSEREKEMILEIEIDDGAGEGK
jgi:hypothetical protein